MALSTGGGNVRKSSVETQVALCNLFHNAVQSPFRTNDDQEPRYDIPSTLDGCQRGSVPFANSPSVEFAHPIAKFDNDTRGR